MNSLVARQRRHFWGLLRFFGLLNSLQRGDLVHKNSLASCQQVLSQRRATKIETSLVVVIFMLRVQVFKISQLHATKNKPLRAVL